MRNSDLTSVSSRSFSLGEGRGKVRWSLSHVGQGNLPTSIPKCWDYSSAQSSYI